MKKLTFVVIAILFACSSFVIAPLSVACLLLLVAGVISIIHTTTNKKTLQPVRVKATRRY